MSEVIKKAEILGDKLIESKAFRALKEAESTLENDTEALKLKKEMEEKQQTFASNRQNEKLKKELISLQQKLWQNEKIKNYIQTQKQFNNLMNKVNNIISQSLGIQQGGCAPGSGCC
ncbi:YlbF family regulator [Halanaerobium hydrogeniformans]|uniref:YlbF family regulator n=1 Tax=Halanaerobium hydrogeniformans TaxID=656519 RepID=E4RJH2_HALHG|nr:YlbF family regulator [Halanaerobium hydrogeniformans]ADQ15392.1 hypothetical protein Halsa_1975 [Halanaerobium hydrogeniformans]